MVGQIGPASYIMLFLLLLAVFGVSSLPRVHAVSCNTTAHYFAGGLDGDTYNDYGTAAQQTIHAQTVCGTSSNKSVVAVWSMDTWASGDFISNGYFIGEYGDGTGYTTTLSYYHDQTIAGSYSFSDISSGTGDYPAASQVISFTLKGSLNTGTHAWSDSVSYPGHYTINISPITMSADYANSGPQTYLESHNNANIGTGDVYSLQNLKYTSPNFAWTSWASGVATTQYPFCAYRISYSHYTMDTSTTGSC
jgi:hypothetical protein